MGELNKKLVLIALLAAFIFPVSVLANTTVTLDRDTVALRLTGPSSCVPGPCNTSTGLGKVSQLVTDVLKDQTLVNWLDVTIRSAMDDNTNTAIIYDKTTWFYQSGYEPKLLLTTCTSIPLLGNVCINLKFDEVDVPADGLIFKYNTSNAVVYLASNTQLDQQAHTGDDTLDAVISLRNVAIDIRIDQPANATWDTCDGNNPSSCINNTAQNVGAGCTGGAGYYEIQRNPYDSNTDASSMLAAYSKAQIPYVDLTASVRLVGTYNDAIHPHIKKIGISLTSINLGLGLSIPLNAGPYCGDVGFPYVKSRIMCPWGMNRDRNGDGNCNRGDDPTYDISEQLVDVIPWVEAEVMYFAQSNFTYPNPSYYFGPAQLADIGDLLADALIDHPLTSATNDWIMLDIGLTMETWADFRGAFIPASLGLDVFYWWDRWQTNNNFNYPTELLTTCVSKTPATVTPVVIGYGQRVFFPTAYTGTPDATQGQWFLKYGSTPQAPGLTSAYHIGLGVHKNRISVAIWDVVTNGILCLTIDKDTPTIGSLLGSVLKTDSFSLFMPELDRWYPSKDMRIEIVPLTYNSSLGAPVASPAYATTGRIASAENGGMIKTGPYQTSAKMPGSIATAVGGVNKTPDLSIVIPHLAISFSINTTGTTWQKAFGLDIGAVLGIDLEITRNSSYSHVFYPNRYPSGCTPCSTACVCTTTGRFLRLGLMADPSVKWFFTYLDAGGVFSSQNYTWSQMSGIFGNIIPVALAGILQMYAELGLDIGQFIGAPFTIDAPYIGYAAPDEDADTIGDWFGLYLNLIGSLNAGIVIDLLTGSGGGGLLGAPPASTNTAYNPVYVPSSADLVHPETYITSASGMDPMYTSISFTGTDMKDKTEDLRYSWRVDGSSWTPFVHQSKIEMGYLLEGQHTFEVTSINSDSVLDPTPASFTFRIDSQGPSVNIVQEGLKFLVDTRDYQTPSDLITVAYRVDGGEWTDSYTSKTIYLKGMSEGSHMLEVKATDDVGNSTVVSHSFNVGNRAGFGCSIVR
jgi:hypothetical protein